MPRRPHALCDPAVLFCDRFLTGRNAPKALIIGRWCLGRNTYRDHYRESSRGGSAPPNPPGSASGAPAGPFRCRIRHLRETLRRTHPSRAPGASFEAVPGPAQFKVRTPEAMLHVSNSLGRSTKTVT
eukprot:13441952-Alexandrium_andersonii.AAC.1